MSYLYNDSEVKCLPYLIIKRYVPSGATELTLTHTICCSVAFLCSHDTKGKKKSFTSLYVLTLQYLPCANEGCKDQVSRICMPESLTCPMSKCMILLQCLLILARHRWKKKKNSQLHPQEEAGSNSLSPHSKGKKGRNVSETQVLPGAMQSYSFVFYFNQKILPKALGTIIYNNTDKSQLQGTPHTSEPTVLALAGLSKRQRINTQLKFTLSIYTITQKIWIFCVTHLPNTAVYI